MVTTPAPQSMSACSFSSASAETPGRRVQPNAASRAFLNLAVFANSKKRRSLGFEPGHPPSM